MTDQTMRAAGAQQFTIGNAIGTTMGVFGRHIVAFSLIPAVMFVPVFIIGVLIVFAFGLQAAFSGNPNDIHGGLFLAAFIFVMLYAAAMVVAMGALAYGTVQDLRHQYAGIGACLSRGFGSVIPLVLAAWGVSILAMLGTILLVVPGIMIWTALAIVGPAIVAERLGAGAGMRRSRELTKGRRWSVFGAIFLTAICLNVVSYILTHVLGPMFGQIANGVLSIVVTVISMGFQGVLVAVIYFQLRIEKEGASLDEIARVFD